MQTITMKTGDDIPRSMPATAKVPDIASVPVNDTRSRRSFLDVFNGLKLAYPKPSAKRRRELHLISERLVK